MLLKTHVFDYFLIASKWSAKDTQEILENFSRAVRLQFGGSLSKAFSTKQSNDTSQEDRNATQYRKDELDRLISGLFLNIFIDLNLQLVNPELIHEPEYLAACKAPSKDTLLPVSQWLLLPVDIQFQVLYKTILAYSKTDLDFYRNKT